MATKIFRNHPKGSQNYCITNIRNEQSITKNRLFKSHILKLKYISTDLVNKPTTTKLSTHNRVWKLSQEFLHVNTAILTDMFKIQKQANMQQWCWFSCLFNMSIILEIGDHRGLQMGTFGD